MTERRRRKQGIFLGATIAVVVVFTVVGCAHGQKNPKSTRPAAVFDGTYRLDQDGAKVTANGAPLATPMQSVTFWYAFRSACGSMGCAATGTTLDNNNHQVAFTPATTTVMRFVGGRWQTVPDPLRVQRPEKQCLGAKGTVVAGEQTVTTASSWEPQPDGTLRGVETDTVVTNECGQQGLVWQYQMVATRVGDVPPGVAVADPATVTVSPATSSPAPTVAGPQLNGAYRVDFDYAHQTIDGVPVSNPGQNGIRWWAFRSLCTSSGCVATGAMLNPANHQEAAGTDPRVLHFADGHWQDTPYLVTNPYPCPPATGQKGSPTLTVVVWSLDPQPDGTLRGIETDTVVTSECGGQGRTYQEPMVVTRDGDVPPAVVLADPTLF